MSFNQTVFQYIYSLTGNPLLDSTMYFLAETLVLFVPLFLTYLWFQGRQGKDDASFTFLATVLGISTTYVMGLFYSHENPSGTYDTVISYHPENSFPSQHTAALLSAGLPLLYRKRKVMGWTLITATVLTGFARIYIGEHWPVDIVGVIPAALAGLGIVYLSWDMLEPLKSPVFDLSDRIEKELREKVGKKKERV